MTKTKKRIVELEQSLSNAHILIRKLQENMNLLISLDMGLVHPFVLTVAPGSRSVVQEPTLPQIREILKKLMDRVDLEVVKKPAVREHYEVQKKLEAKEIW